MAEKDLAALVSEARAAWTRRGATLRAIATRPDAGERAPSRELVDAWQQADDEAHHARNAAIAELDRLIDGGT